MNDIVPADTVLQAAAAESGRRGAAAREWVEGVCEVCGGAFAGLRTKRTCDDAYQKRAGRRARLVRT